MPRTKIYVVKYTTENDDKLHTFNVYWKWDWCLTLTRMSFESNKAIWTSVCIFEEEPTKYGDYTATRCVYSHKRGEKEMFNLK